MSKIIKKVPTEYITNTDEEGSTWKRKILGFVIVKCNCGEEIECRNFTNTCNKCEADYNYAGQQLAARSQWGEETGEHWSDCY